MELNERSDGTVSVDLLHRAVKAYQARGWQPIPVRPKSKAPAVRGWPNFRLNGDLAHHFPPGSNVGVLLGEPSGWLVDVDVDAAEAVPLADRLLPPTLTFGRPSAPRTHRLFVAPGAKTEKFYGRDVARPLIEIRATGCQTLFPPSVHPSGEQVDFDRSGPAMPARIDAAELRQRVALVAVGTILLPRWREGVRHDAAMAVSGFLLRAGVRPDLLESLYDALADLAGDNELKDRLRTIRTTVARLNGDRTAYGLPQIERLLGRDVAEALARIFPSGQTQRPIPPAAEPAGDWSGENLPNVSPLLPDFLREILGAFRTPNERDAFLLSALACLSAALPNVEIPYGAHLYRPALYALTVGLSGSGKGAALWAYRLVKPIDTRLQEETRAALAAWEEEAAAARAAKMPPPPRPTERLLIAAEASSELAIARRLQENDSVLLFSTETDTLAAILSTDWGNWSHLLRKAWHHEPIRRESKADGSITVDAPTLALSITATPRQVWRLLQDAVEDGLYSRLLIARLPDQDEWICQKPRPEDRRLHETVAAAGRLVFDVWQALRQRKAPLIFTLSDEQWERHTEVFAALYRTVVDATALSGETALRAVVQRAGLIAVRIAAILTIYKTPVERLATVEALEAEDDAFEAALLLTEACTRASLAFASRLVADTLAKELAADPARRTLSSLPEEFTASEFYTASGASERTARRWLRRLEADGLIVQLARGRFRKRTPDMTEMAEVSDLSVLSDPTDVDGTDRTDTTDTTAMTGTAEVAVMSGSGETVTTAATATPDTTAIPDTAAASPEDAAFVDQRFDAGDPAEESPPGIWPKRQPPAPGASLKAVAHERVFLSRLANGVYALAEALGWPVYHSEAADVDLPPQKSTWIAFTSEATEDALAHALIDLGSRVMRRIGAWAKQRDFPPLRTDRLSIAAGEGAWRQALEAASVDRLIEIYRATLNQTLRSHDVRPPF